MTKVSRYKLDPEKRNLILNDFWSAVTLLDDKKQISNFFKSLLTHTEMEMVSKRIQIVKMLLNGRSYEEIKRTIKVTDSTIARINNLLASENNGLEAAIVKLRKIEADLDKERMRIGPNLKKKYPSYFLPEIIIDKVEEKGKQTRKRESPKRVL